ncbi:MAG: hypothetical protein IH907_03515 [Proteobacteria bacterium]|nr:hypothetical protein [Pseudomonadota bacterium]
MRKAPVIALSGVLGIALVWLVVSRNNGETVKHSGLDGHAPSDIEVTGLQNPDNEEINIGTDTPESGESAVIAKPVTLEPVDVRQWRMSHGYYGSGSNDPGSKHPYEYYDTETLEQLALNDDGLAQLMMGMKLAFSTEHGDRARQFYWQAAVNGFTAGLAFTATDRMLLRLGHGSTSFDFPIKNEEGDISDELADRLKFLAAAEYLGDFVASQMLRAFLDSFELGDSGASRTRICRLGLELANQIKAERIDKSGGLRWPADIEVSLEKPKPICSI